MKQERQWEKLFIQTPTPVKRLEWHKGVEISVKRDDLNHRIVQGNKLRKLKYNLKYIIDKKINIVATFGGAWSNHILATAKASNYCGVKSVGFIRGDELINNKNKWSPTLLEAEKQGMKLVFLSRQEYRLKLNAPLVKTFMQNIQDKMYLIPEGGSNRLAIKGVVEIIEELNEQVEEPTHIVTACGTGGTMAGLIDGACEQGWKTTVLGISVLKGAEFLNNEMKNLSKHQGKIKWKLYGNYHAGGYAKMDDKTLGFANEFTQKNSIELDQIYNAKSFYATYDLIKKGTIPKGSKVVILHTGGLQGGVF